MHDYAAFPFLIRGQELTGTPVSFSMRTAMEARGSAASRISAEIVPWLTSSSAANHSCVFPVRFIHLTRRLPPVRGSVEAIADVLP